MGGYNPYLANNPRRLQESSLSFEQDINGKKIVERMGVTSTKVKDVVNSKLVESSSEQANKNKFTNLKNKKMSPNASIQ